MNVEMLYKLLSAVYIELCILLCSGYFDLIALTPFNSQATFVNIT